MTKKTAAARYARALLEMAVQESGDLQQIQDQLAGFVELLKQYPALEKVLFNPAVPVPRKRAAVAELTAQVQTTPMVTRLLALLADRDRLVLLPDLLESYRDRLLAHRHVVRAEVTTIVPLAADRAKAIERSLAEVTGQTVMLETKIDPGIVGGVVARIGSTVYDGSVTRQLEKMKQRMVESV
jgi:F-type H+-transporting ATPase subunit delta